jgi:hypothetical protein
MVMAGGGSGGVLVQLGGASAGATTLNIVSTSSTVSYTGAPIAGSNAYGYAAGGANFNGLSSIFNSGVTAGGGGMSANVITNAVAGVGGNGLVGGGGASVCTTAVASGGNGGTGDFYAGGSANNGTGRTFGAAGGGAGFTGAGSNASGANGGNGGSGGGGGGAPIGGGTSGSGGDGIVFLYY